MLIHIDTYGYIIDTYTYGVSVTVASYHSRCIPLERNGMDRLLAMPIPVSDVDRAEQLEGTGHVGHILQPFQRRMELNRYRCKLSVPAIGCRKPELGHLPLVIMQEEWSSQIMAHVLM